MEITRNGLEQTYAGKTTEELAELSLNDLTPLAKEVIEHELEKRKTSSKDAAQIIDSVKNTLLHKAEKLEENIGRISSRKKRLLAQIIDTTIAFIMYLILINFGDIGIWTGTFVFFLYIWLADGLFKGRSVGKLITKTSVIIVSTGKPCTYGRSFIRNILLTCLGFIDWVFIFGDKNQRLGDKVAGTIVVNTIPVNKDEI